MATQGAVLNHEQEEEECYTLPRPIYMLSKLEGNKLRLWWKLNKYEFKFICYKYSN